MTGTTDTVGFSVTIDAELERFERNMREAGRLVETTGANMDKSTRRAAQSFNRLEAALDPVARAQQRLQRDTQRVQSALDRGAVSAERAAQVQRRLNDQYEQAVARLNSVSVASTRVAANSNQAVGGFSRVGGAAQNAAFQVGDFFTQIASGQSATRALAQQLPQLLGGLGAMGAVFGAAAAAAGALVPMLFDADDAATDLASTTDALTDAQSRAQDVIGSTADEVEKLAARWREADAATRSFLQADIETRLLTLRESIRSSARALRLEFQEAQGDLGIGVVRGGATDEFGGMGAANTLDQVISRGVPPLTAVRAVQAIGTLQADPTAEGVERARNALVTLRSEMDEVTPEANEFFARAFDQITAVEEAAGVIDDMTLTLDRLAAGLPPAADGMGSLSDSSDSASQAIKEMDRAVNRALADIAGLGIETRILTDDGFTPLDAKVLEFEQRLTDAGVAMQAANALTAQYRQGLERLSAAQAAAAANDDLAKLVERTSTSMEAYQQRVEELEGLRAFADTPEEIRAIERAMRSAADEVDSFGNSIKDGLVKSFDEAGDALADFVETGKLDFRSLADSIISDLFRIAVQQSIVNPFQDFVGNLFSGGLNLFGGAGGFGSSPTTGTGGLYAQGGVFDAGREVTAFARGGIVDRPTLFPFARGVGLMGEAGPEAIMPLRRLPSGDLGVQVAPGKAAAVGGSGPVFNVDMRGADVAAVQRLERLVAEVNGSIESRAVGAVVGARNRNPKLFR